jgi:hypothetical protein
MALRRHWKYRSRVESCSVTLSTTTAYVPVLEDKSLARSRCECSKAFERFTKKFHRLHGIDGHWNCRRIDLEQVLSVPWRLAFSMQ